MFIYYKGLSPWKRNFPAFGCHYGHHGQRQDKIVPQCHCWAQISESLLMWHPDKFVVCVKP